MTRIGSRAGAVLVIIGTFALGMIAGGALLHIARRGAGLPPRRPPIEHLRSELDLSAAQMEKLRAILEESRERMRGVADDTRDRIRAVLTPEQRERFEAMGPPPPGPPGGPPGPPPDGPPGFPPPGRPNAPLDPRGR